MRLWFAFALGLVRHGATLVSTLLLLSDKNLISGTVFMQVCRAEPLQGRIVKGVVERPLFREIVAQTVAWLEQVPGWNAALE